MDRVPVTTREQAQTVAIEWQAWMSENSLSFGELAEWQSYFEELGERFNLTDEFRENGIV
jgi:hypothetical protein